MTLGRTSSGAIKIKTDGGTTRAVECACCGCGSLPDPNTICILGAKPTSVWKQSPQGCYIEFIYNNQSDPFYPIDYLVLGVSPTDFVCSSGTTVRASIIAQGVFLFSNFTYICDGPADSFYACKANKEDPVFGDYIIGGCSDAGALLKVEKC